MVPGENDWKEYYKSVTADFIELRKYYPFSTMYLFPTTVPTPVEMDVIAANGDLIESMRAEKSDFLGDYSRKLKIVVPLHYQKIGCNVYGGGWFDLSKIHSADRHFYIDNRKFGGYQLCVGVPKSFCRLKNVILENVRTAEQMLIAYEEIQSGKSSVLHLKAYLHGDAGERQYKYDRKKYTSK